MPSILETLNDGRPFSERITINNAMRWARLADGSPSSLERVENALGGRTQSFNYYVDYTISLWTRYNVAVRIGATVNIADLERFIRFPQEYTVTTSFHVVEAREYGRRQFLGLDIQGSVLDRLRSLRLIPFGLIIAFKPTATASAITDTDLAEAVVNFRHVTFEDELVNGRNEIQLTTFPRAGDYIWFWVSRTTTITSVENLTTRRLETPVLADANRSFDFTTGKLYRSVGPYIDVGRSGGPVPIILANVTDHS